MELYFYNNLENWDGGKYAVVALQRPEMERLLH